MELKMELKTAIEILEYHQGWRLGKREDMIHEPQKLTEALDVVINEVKKLRLADVGGSVFFTTEEVKDLKRVRNYFGWQDKTLFEHWAYSYLDNILNSIHTDR